MEENKLNEELKEETSIEENSEENATEEVESTEVVETESEATEEVKEEKAPYDGPSVTVVTRYDYSTLKYYNVMSMVYKKHYPVLYLVLAAFCLAYVGVQLAQIIPVMGTEDFSANQLLMPGIFVIFAVYSIYLFFNFEKSVDKNLTMHFNQYPEVSSVQSKITLEGITVTSSKNPENPYFYDWVYITQIIEIDKYYYFFSGKQPIIVSKDVNNVLEGDYETLKSIIDEQITKKPYKKIEKEILKYPVTYVHQCDMDNSNTVVVEDNVEEVKQEETETIEVVEENNENNDNKEE